MRKGQNPARVDLPAYNPHRLGVASLVYIPHLEGYFSQSFEILKIQLASLRANTGEDFDLLVFDNGSCPEVQEDLQKLQADGWMDWLILSRHNLGKTGAFNWILNVMPNKIIGYCDSDVFFRKGWFNESIKILDAFPQAAIVTAQPIFFDVFRGEGKAHLELSLDEYERMDFHPSSEAVDEYCLGIDASAELTAEYHRRALTAYRSKANGVQALLWASHMQFIGRSEVLRSILPLAASRSLSPEEDRQFDMRLNQKGYVHLSTTESYVYHIGNTLDEHIQPEIGKLKMPNSRVIKAEQPTSEESFARRLFAKLANSRLFGSLFKKLYNTLFQIYSKG